LKELLPDITGSRAGYLDRSNGNTFQVISLSGIHTEEIEIDGMLADQWMKNKISLSPQKPINGSEGLL
jgi:hypothetical protein